MVYFVREAARSCPVCRYVHQHVVISNFILGSACMHCYLNFFRLIEYKCLTIYFSNNFYQPLCVSFAAFYVVSMASSNLVCFCFAATWLFCSLFHYGLKLWEKGIVLYFTLSQVIIIVLQSIFLA